MSSYPILDNRPIDQWKVTELKEELKRRKLTTKGLKDDLIRRLDEAIRIERENEVDNGVDSDPQAEAEVKDSETTPVVSEGPVGHGAENDEKIDDSRVQVNITKKSSVINEATVEGEETGVGSDVGREDMDPVAAPDNLEATMKTTETVVTGTTISETLVTETVSSNSAEPGTMVTEEAVPPSTTEMKPSGNEGLVEEKALTGLNQENSVILDGGADGTLKTQVENEELKPLHEDAILESAALSNQVSEVSPTLGNLVKSDSISTDSVSINEKNEFKDNIIADNIKLELDVTKPEMVEPSSSHVVPEIGDSHPMDVEAPHGIKLAVKDENDGNAPNEDLNKNNETADGGYSEKLNLDRSSGDDSMDEDLPESKDADSGHRVVKIENKDEKIDVTMVKEEITVDITGDVDVKDIEIEKDHSSVLAEKRKLQEGSNENNEPLKRQRKWKSENIKVPEPQNLTVTPTVTPGGSAQTTTFKRSFSRSDSLASDDAPKERVVPPSQKTPTNSLRVDRFLRPFTLKAVQELLGKTGTVTSFWMDHIKTHCYVSYSSVEEAIETRNAVYNLQWPPNGGRLLVADFVEPQEVKMRLENPPQTSAPASAVPVDNAAPATQTTAKPQPSRQQMSKQQLPPPPPPPPPAAAPASHPPRERERLPLPPPPPLPEKADSTIVTLDVLFRKTKATPRIYYLPLSEDQVAAKLAARGRATRQ